MHQRRRVSGRQVRGGTDFPASKIAKTKNVPREANKLWGEKFSWIRERERRGGGRGTTRGWHKEEYGVRRWRCANEFSMPFPYPISMIGVYRRERLIENFGRIELFVCPFDFHFRRAFFHYILLILALSMILLERKIDRKFFGTSEEKK